MATMLTSGGYYILTVTSEDKVPSRLKLLHEGVLFLLMREKICSSAAFKWGIKALLLPHEKVNQKLSYIKCG